MFDQYPIEAVAVRRYSSPWMIPLAMVAIGAILVTFRTEFAHGFTFVHETILGSPVLRQLGPLVATVGADKKEVIALAPQPPELPVFAGSPSSTAPTSTAAAVLVKDDKTGTILFDKDEYVSRPLASITKLMSTILILESNPQWTSTTQVVSDDVEDTHMYAGDTYTIDQLWHAALIGSSNKAILTLVDAIGAPRSTFVDRMNAKARELGMASTTNFVEPTGLDADNVGSASDVLILLREALHHPEIRDTLITQEYDLYSKERKQKHHIWNTDWLLLGWIPSKLTVIGGKTGYIPSAGYNFTVQLKDAAGRTLDVVVLGARSNEARFREAGESANWVLKNFHWPEAPSTTSSTVMQPS